MNTQMNKPTACPICSTGSLIAQPERSEVSYQGRKGYITTHFAVCDCCNAFITDNEASRANKRAVLAFRKSVHGGLSSDEIKAIRIRYGLTQDTAQRIFGGGPKAFSKYESDDVVPAASMDKLLRIVRDHPAVMNTLFELAGLPTTPSLNATEQHKLLLNLPISYSTDSENSLPSVSVLFNDQPNLVGAVKEHEFHH